MRFVCDDDIGKSKLIMKIFIMKMENEMKTVIILLHEMI